MRQGTEDLSQDTCLHRKSSFPINFCHASLLCDFTAMQQFRVRGQFVVLLFKLQSKELTGEIIMRSAWKNWLFSVNLPPTSLLSSPAPSDLYLSSLCIQLLLVTHVTQQPSIKTERDQFNVSSLRNKEKKTYAITSRFCTNFIPLHFLNSCH